MAGSSYDDWKKVQRDLGAGTVGSSGGTEPALGMSAGAIQLPAEAKGALVDWLDLTALNVQQLSGSDESMRPAGAKVQALTRSTSGRSGVEVEQVTAHALVFKPGVLSEVDRGFFDAMSGVERSMTSIRRFGADGQALVRLAKALQPR